ncbi:MAG: diadenylate cyclase [Planctomycetales bacterium]|nr:diadenylate cyclase [Planctomycetales bacterium]
MMVPSKTPEHFASICKMGVLLAEAEHIDTLMVMVEGALNWEALKEAAGGLTVLTVADYEHELAGAAEAGLDTILLDMPEATVFDKLTQALLESVADDQVKPGAQVVALYSGFDPARIDSVSVLNLSEHLGRLTVRDLRKLETSVPLDTLKAVVDLAVEIGREGREGKPIGTLMIVGDHRKVLKHASPLGFDPVKGYKRDDRNLFDNRVREGIKEIAPLDGAFVIAADGTVEAAAQVITAPAAELTLSKGLGSRHWAAATISRATKAIAVVVSESSGTVRLFQNGEVVLRVEPLRRAMKWRDGDFEVPPGGE